MRALLLAFSACFIAVWPAGAGDLTALKQVGPFHIGPSNFRDLPREWTDWETKKPCTCHRICRYEIPLVDVLNINTEYPPKNQCGVQTYHIWNAPNLRQLPFQPIAIGEFGKSEQDILRDYGRPTYRTTRDGIQLAYCTDVAGRILTLKEARSAGEMYEYGFRLDPFTRKVEGVRVIWTDKCRVPPIPSVP